MGVRARNLETDVGGLRAIGFLSRCDEAARVGDIENVVADLGNSLGYEHYLVRGVIRSTFGPSLNLLLTNYPANWLNQYRMLRYSEVDPAFAYARAAVRPTSLAGLLNRSDKQKLFDSFRKDVSEAGLSEGITVPLRSCSVWGFFNVNGSCGRTPSHGALTTCTLVGAAVVDALERLRGANDVFRFYAKLTYREKQVLFWSLGGKTAWETAMILGITERTVVAHLSSGMRTMRCVNKAQLLGIASECLQSDPALADTRIEF